MAVSNALSRPSYICRMKAGFTLIELSIVLVIIGLIAGGVLVGMEMIETARLNKTIATVERYQLAISAYRLKYNHLPGDHPTASRFFSGATNGNGNGIVDRIVNPINGTGLFNDYMDCPGSESFLVNEHLSQADMISLGPFLITSGAAAVCQPNIGWIDPVGKGLDALVLFNTDKGVFLRMGGAMESPGQFGIPDGSSLTPMQAQRIDRKLDDGMPRPGSVWNQDQLTSGGAKVDWTQVGSLTRGCQRSIGGTWFYSDRETISTTGTGNYTYCGLFFTPNF